MTLPYSNLSQGDAFLFMSPTHNNSNFFHFSKIYFCYRHLALMVYFICISHYCCHNGRGQIYWASSPLFYKWCPSYLSVIDHNFLETFSLLFCYQIGRLLFSYQFIIRVKKNKHISFHCSAFSLTKKWIKTNAWL